MIEETAEVTVRRVYLGHDENGARKKQRRRYAVSPQFPPIEPYDSGMLDVGDGHRVYWECCGNPEGQARALPPRRPGSGASPGQRRFFDPDAYRIVVFDQRGSGAVGRWRASPIPTSAPTPPRT